MSSKNQPVPSKASFIKRLRLFLLYSFPVVLFCSYYPLIRIISVSATNLELSLPLIWLFLFSVLSLKDFFITIYNIYKNHRTYLLSFLFPLYLTASILWSANPLRATMTAGVIWCLVITSITILTTFRSAKAINKNKLLKIFFVSTIAFCVLCWIQSILDCFDVDRNVTLLCSGCTSYSFGFPHPSGLAIEPQFMGNLLLAPTLTALYLWAKAKSSTAKDSPFGIKTLLALSLFFSSTLFLTLSRGAIYAFIISFIVLLAISVIRFHCKQFWKTIPLLILSFLFTVLMQGVFSAVSYTDSTFASGIENSISQLSLGKINLNLTHTPSNQTDPESLPESSVEDSITPVFDGYVEESTNVRMDLNRIAIELAPKTPTALIFGYGLGSAGEVMYQEGKTASAYELIQNEYLSLLLETGVIGLLLAALAVVITIIATNKFMRPFDGLINCIILSFLLSLLFFSGLPNAIHIYLFPILLSVSLPHHPRLKIPHASSRKHSSSRV